MEVTYYKKSVAETMAVQRASKGSGRDQPEGADRQSAFHGRGRTDHPDGLSGGSAQSGICIKRPWKILKTDPGFYGRVGQFI